MQSNLQEKRLIRVKASGNKVHWRIKNCTHSGWSLLRNALERATVSFPPPLKTPSTKANVFVELHQLANKSWINMYNWTIFLIRNTAGVTPPSSSSVRRNPAIHHNLSCRRCLNFMWLRTAGIFGGLKQWRCCIGESSPMVKDISDGGDDVSVLDAAPT